MKNKIAIIGSGAVATAMGKILNDSGQKDITIYGIDEQEILNLRNGINPKYFPNSVELPKFKTTLNLKDAVDGATHVIMAAPSKVLDVLYPNVLGSLNSKVLVINVAKGFYPGTSSSIHKEFKKKSNEFVRGVVSLTGPSHAEEMVIGMPTMVTIVDSNKKIALEVQKLFENDYFKTKIQTDVNGAETGGAFKNVIAIISGISDGLGYGINTRAAILTIGLNEMVQFNKASKGKTKTMYGLSGLGDLIVTASSPLSRNYSFGLKFAKEGIKSIKTTETVEGLSALNYIYEIAREKQIDLPIVNLLYEVISGKKPSKDLIKLIWKNSDNKFE